jgi:hypothetical protein
MELLIEILVVILIASAAWAFAYYLVISDTKFISRYTDFYTDMYFDKKHRPLFDKLIANGSSEKEAYQIIIANQDNKLLSKRILFLFYFILTIVAYWIFRFFPELF